MAGRKYLHHLSDQQLVDYDKLMQAQMEESKRRQQEFERN